MPSSALLLSESQPHADVSEDDIRAQLNKDEAEVLKAAGKAPLHQTSASSFLTMGLELEESKYVAQL